jgi:hypothetical protein
MRGAFISLTFLLLGLSGCTNMDRVAPMSWTYYLGSGMSESEIRLALLECGSNVPGDEREFYKPGGNGFLLPGLPTNEFMLVVTCMKNAGFVNSQFGKTCNHPNAKDLPACSPDAVIPVRSVANRLNSPFCQLVPRAKICQPDYDPSEVEPNTQKNPNPKSIFIAPSIDPAIKLQNQVQKDSNAQMNQLLQGTGGRK